MSLRLGRNEIVGQEEATTGRCNGCCGNRVRSKEQQGGAVVAKRLGRGGSGKGKQRRMATATGDKWQRWAIVVAATTRAAASRGAVEAMGSADVATGGEEWLTVVIKEESKAATDE
ncbi:hypothetical protein BHM03_00040465 [Ensete ventricosum]|nr:hypothetical protein BHM03_00040465 [Ensete ventricosum]